MSQCGLLYSVWENATDRLVISDGTLIQCSYAMGISPSSFASIKRRNATGECKKWTILVTGKRTFLEAPLKKTKRQKKSKYVERQKEPDDLLTMCEREARELGMSYGNFVAYVEQQGMTLADYFGIVDETIEVSMTMKTCPYCGREYYAGSKRVTCGSADCQRLRENERDRERKAKCRNENSGGGGELKLDC